MKKASPNLIESDSKELIENDKPNKSKPEELTETHAQRCLRVYGVKPSNTKVGKAFMTSYQKPKEDK